MYCGLKKEAKTKLHCSEGAVLLGTVKRHLVVIFFCIVPVLQSRELFLPILLLYEGYFDGQDVH
jgi:hypothetical protein